jgi:hypothetical protein
MKPERIVISFDSDRFDVDAEPENDVNPIRGHSFLAWLAGELAPEGYRVDGPSTEDWGWYLDVEGPAGRYLVGATALPGAGKVADWTIQITRSRSIRERLRGAGRIGLADPLVRSVEQHVRKGAGATDVGIEVLDDRGRNVDEA